MTVRIDRLCGFIGPGDTCTYAKGHDGTHSWDFSPMTEQPSPTPRTIRGLQTLRELPDLIRGSWTPFREEQWAGTIVAIEEEAAALGTIHTDIAWQRIQELARLASQSSGTSDDHEHNFVDPTNEVVHGAGWLVCTVCGKLQAPAPSSKQVAQPGGEE